MSLPRFGSSQIPTSLNRSVRDQLLNNRSIVPQNSKLTNSMSTLSAISRSVNVVGTDYVSCPSHPNYFITNMCVSQGCIEPLCPECIPDHLTTHIKQQDEPQVENIQNIRENLKQKSVKYLQRLLEDMNDVDNHQLGKGGVMQDNFLQKSLQQLNEAKNKVLHLVDQVFDQHEQQIRQKLSRHYNLEHEFQQVREHLEKELKKIQMLLEDFDSPNLYVKAIIYSIDTQIGEPNNGVLAQLEEEIHHYERQLPEIVIDIRALDEVYNGLHEYIQMKSQIPLSMSQQLKPKSSLVNQKNDLSFANPFYDAQQQNQEHLQQLARQQQQQQLLQQGQNNKQMINNVYTSQNTPTRQDVDVLSGLLGKQPQFASNHQELTQSPIRSAYPQLRIEHPSGNAAFICTLLDDQKYGLVYTYGQNKQVELVELDVENRLPHNHGCIIVDGNIYIFGGIVKDFDRNNAVSSVYRINLKQQKVQLLCNMINRRSSFGIALVGSHHIYAVGGSLTESESQGISQFERMDVSSKKWTPLAPSLNKATGCTLASFHEKFLVKFGGLNQDFNIISDFEVYNIKRDYWSKVKIFDQNGNEWNDLPTRAGAAQINQDEILIFGGSIHDEKTDDSWLAHIEHGDEISEVRIRRTHSIPFQSDVKTPIIFHNNKIYAFINRQENGQSQSSRKLRVLIEGSAEGWTQVG